MNHIHISFGSIESFHNKVKQANKKYVHEMMYHVKPKLHGTNAGIVVSREGVYAQSRKNVITPEKDNAGFATFVDSLGIDNYINNLADGTTWVVYGEWAGQGIQKNDAVSMIPKKAFFAICFRSIQTCIDGKVDEMVFHDPGLVEMALEELGILSHPDIYVIPYMAQLPIHMSDVQSLEAAETTVNSYVDQFETVDPYIESVFGIKAPGEGVVVAPNSSSWDVYHEWSFKAKTKAHSVNKSKKAASAKVQVSPDVIDFAERFATVPRFIQAMDELNIEADMKNMGKFLKWVNEDVIKESKDELEESELDWKKCSKQITNRARDWFMTESRKVV